MNALPNHNFPAYPSLNAQWAPIYMEPIMKSGERITVGIAAIPASGEPEVVTALREEGVKCAFGERGQALYESASLCLDALRDHLRRTGTFSDWAAPFYGVEIGTPRLGVGNSVTEIVRMALRMTASFSALEPEAEDRIIEQAIEGEDRWPKQIRAALKGRSPGLDANFNRPFRIVQGGTDTKFDYLGSRLAAYFGKVVPIAQRKSGTIKDARAKLWTLARLRDAGTTLDIGTYELILYRPQDDDAAYSESQIKMLHEMLIEIREEGKREAISTFETSLAEDAARQIELREAA